MKNQRASPQCKCPRWELLVFLCPNSSKPSWLSYRTIKKLDIAALVLGDLLFLPALGLISQDANKRVYISRVTLVHLRFRQNHQPAGGFSVTSMKRRFFLRLGVRAGNGASLVGRSSGLKEDASQRSLK